jgi:hypothetical protein
LFLLLSAAIEQMLENKMLAVIGTDTFICVFHTRQNYIWLLHLSLWITSMVCSQLTFYVLFAQSDNLVMQPEKCGVHQKQNRVERARGAK